MEALDTPTKSETVVERPLSEGSSFIDNADIVFQERMLAGVSRTFALTIPQLPPDLKQAIGNAYLLCRLADTIEDDADLSTEQKMLQFQTFTKTIETCRGAEDFASELYPKLSEATPAPERELVHQFARVIHITSNLDPRQKASIARCVAIMCRGMDRFERLRSPQGLETLRDHESYCYHVAGVVGEMLTDYFCVHSERINSNRKLLMSKAVRFGQGLQMTNILKDIWTDQDRGTCWLPRDVFDRHGFDLKLMRSKHPDPAFDRGINDMVGIAYSCLRDALAYTLLIPRRETGIRKFLLWSIGLAILTLRKIHRNPGYASGTQVKISRRAVKSVIAATNALSSSNTALSAVFSLATGGLPATPPTTCDL